MNDQADDKEERFDFSYDVEVYGAQKRIVLPFVIGIIADLCGFRPGDENLPLEDRRFRWIDSDNFDNTLGQANASIMVSLPDELDQGIGPVRLCFKELGDFEPLAVVRQIDPLNRVLTRRSLLAEIRDKLAAKPTLYSSIQSLAERLKETGPRKINPIDTSQGSMPGEERLSECAAAWPGISPRLLAQIDASKERALGLIDALADELTQDRVSADAPLLESLESCIVQLDDWLANHVNLIIHRPEFQRLEATWRGIDYLIRSVGTSEVIKICCFSASKQELQNDLRVSSKILLKRCVQENYGIFGGEPYGLLVADFSFDQSADDLALLEILAEAAEAAGAPLIAMPKPSLFDCDSFRDLERKRRLTELFKLPEYTAWRRFCEKQTARYVSFVLPRVVGRSLHMDAGGKPSHFQFQEKIDTMDSWVWMNSAFVLAAQFAQAHHKDGWLASEKIIEAGMVVENLTTCDYINDKGEPVFCCPTEASFNNFDSSQLNSIGLICLYDNSVNDAASFNPIVSLYKPRAWRGPDYPLTADLCLTIFLCNISRYVRCLTRDRINRYQSIGELSEDIINWLNGYVQSDIDDLSEISVKKPLSYGSIDLIQSSSCPGAIEASMWIQPLCHNVNIPPMEIKFFLPIPPRAFPVY